MLKHRFTLVTIQPNKTSHTLTGLQVGRAYTITIRAKNSAVDRLSDAASFTTKVLTTLSTPTGLTATARTAPSATLTWAAVPGALQYRVVCTPSTGSAISLTVNTTTATLNGLKSTSTYDCVVNAIRNNEVSADATLTLTLNATTATARGLKLKVTKATRMINATWLAASAPDLAVNGYLVEVAYGAGKFVRVKQLGKITKLSFKVAKTGVIKVRLTPLHSGGKKGKPIVVAARV